MKSILLIGLGRFGKHIALHLNHLGHQVMAVDTSEERVEAVLPLVTNAQIGDSTNADFLESLGVRNYDVCIVAIGNNFQSSLETTSLLSELGARFVVSRAATDVQEKFLLRNGANEVVYPEKQLAKWTAIRYSADHILDYIELDENHAMFEIPIPKDWADHSIGELDIRKKFNINIMGIKKSGNQNVYGVAGIAVNGTPLDSFENSVLLSILGECALALENIKNAKEKEEAAVLAQNEQLRANLLRAISHDLRTPLTAISGSADNLLANYKKMDDALREQTFTDIYDDSMWLINLVENLLAVTRIEGGQVNLTWSIELMDEVVSEALKHINRKSKEHTIRVTSGKDFILAHIDAKLIVQVIINLVDNAIKYTPVGSVIEIHTDQKEQWVTVSVSDNGPGIPDEQKPRIFDMFYSGANKVVDSRRSLGLGLSLCKSIVTAHGGTISVSDNQPNGTVFKFTLPAEEVELHE